MASEKDEGPTAPSSGGTLAGNQSSDDISYLLFLWIMPGIVGIPGNILAILVANRKRNRDQSPCVYMKAMGVADTVLLFERIMAVILNKVLLEYGVVSQPLWFFRMQGFIMYTSSMLSGLFLAGMSIDRLIAVQFPLRAKRLCTPSRARTSVIVLSLIIPALNSYLFYVIYYFKDRELGVYAVLITSPDFAALEIISSVFQVVVGTVLPFIIILTSNILIGIALGKASVKRKKLTTQQGTTSDSRHHTRMLIFVSFAYVITTLPYRLLHLLMKIPYIANTFDLDFIKWRKQYVLITWSLVILWMLNFACNFYLYCLGGGRKYREDAKRVIKKLFVSKSLKLIRNVP